MNRTLALVIAAVLAAACRSGDDAPAEQPVALDPPTTPGSGGGLKSFDDGLHAGRGASAVGKPAAPPRMPLAGEPDRGTYRRPTARGRSIELVLRSTPPGSIASIDGKRIGPTPTFWRGAMTGKPREFTFELADYTPAHYRFVPTTNGVVHATLEPVVADHDDHDAGPGAH